MTEKAQCAIRNEDPVGQIRNEVMEGGVEQRASLVRITQAGTDA